MQIVPIENLNKEWSKGIPDFFFGLERLGFAWAFNAPTCGSNFWGLWNSETAKVDGLAGGWVVWAGREAIIDGKKEPWFFDSEYFRFNNQDGVGKITEEMLEFSKKNPVVLVFLTNDDISYGMRFTSEDEASDFLSSFEDITQMIEKVGNLLETHNG